MLRVIQHQVEQLEPAVQGGLGGLRILRRPPDRAADFTPDIAELLRERQTLPAAARGVRVLPLGHRRTTRAMNAAIAARVAGIIDAPRPVAEGRPEIDHGIEFQPVLSSDVRVEIDPPEIRLLRAVGQQAGLLIGMQVGIEQQNAAFEIDDALDHVAEPRLGERADFVQGIVSDSVTRLIDVPGCILPAADAAGTDPDARVIDFFSPAAQFATTVIGGLAADDAPAELSRGHPGAVSADIPLA